MPGTPIQEVPIGQWTAKVLSKEPYGYSNGQGGPNRFVTYFLEGEDALTAPQFVDYLVGVGSFGSTIFDWPAPHKYPGSNLPCLQASLQALKGPAQPSADLIASDAVAIRAEYGTSTWNGLDYDVYGTENEELFGLQVPWSSVDMDGQEEEHQITGETADGEVFNRGKRRLTIMEFQVARSYIPNPAAFLTLARTLNNKVNSTTFMGASAGKMLFSNPSMRNHWDANGGLVRSFHLSLRERSVEWNKVLKPGYSDTWVIPKDKDGVDSLSYASGELNNLLRFGVV